MTKDSPARDFDSEIAAMIALATSVTDGTLGPHFAFPVPSLAQTPGVIIVSTTQQGEADANEREDCR